MEPMQGKLASSQFDLGQTDQFCVPEVTSVFFSSCVSVVRHDRSPDKRLFLFKSGCLVHFAMDLDYVTMTTKLCGDETYFLPFNQGKKSVYNLKNGESIIETGDGNAGN